MTRKMQQIIDDEQNALVKQARSMTTKELIIFIALVYGGDIFFLSGVMVLFMG